MSAAEKSVDTPHGRLDREALERARDSYDTTSLLRTVDELAELLGEVAGEDGWRDQLLRLHRMAHTVINGASFTGATGETLPELALAITAQMSDAVDRLQSWIRRIELLQELEARDGAIEGPRHA